MFIFTFQDWRPHLKPGYFFVDQVVECCEDKGRQEAHHNQVAHLNHNHNQIARLKQQIKSFSQNYICKFPNSNPISAPTTHLGCLSCSIFWEEKFTTMQLREQRGCLLNQVGVRTYRGEPLPPFQEKYFSQLYNFICFNLKQYFSKL